MELRHLRYFLAVAEHGSFNGAAEVLYVTQPALSRQIHDLEQELGTVLFQRLPKGTRLTDAGRVFREHARRVFEELDAARTRIERMARGQTGVLKVGFNSIAMSNRVVPEALRSHRMAQREVELKISSLTSLQQLDALQHDTLDVGFLNAVPDQHRELCFHEVSACTLDIALPRAHALADGRAIKLVDLRHEEFIWPMRARVPWVYDQLIAACLARGFSPRIIQESSDIETLLGMLDAGLGVGFVPSCLSERVSANLVVRPIVDLHQPWPLYLVWRKSDESPLTASFVRTVREAHARLADSDSNAGDAPADALRAASRANSGARAEV